MCCAGLFNLYSITLKARCYTMAKIRERETDRQSDRQTDRQTDRQRQTDRDRQRDRERQ